VKTLLRSHFLLNPHIVFLNHGSFGACPQPVFETYQRWQRELEAQPVEFLGRMHDPLMNDARAVLAEYVNGDVDNLVFVPNATAGINAVARSLPLKPGDEILTTDHEYGALNYTWDFVCQRTGAKYIQRTIPLPLTSDEEFVEHFWAGVTPNTRVIYLSHVTSPTALIFPLEEICRRARAADILTVIDGAHAPGHVPIDLKDLDPDFYSGNCHKWLCAPKGSAFLYSRADHHTMLNPLVISWGWAKDASFVSKFQVQGTRDLAAFLTVPAAIRFQEEHHWSEVQQSCHQLVADAWRTLTGITELAPLSSEAYFGQMVTVPLPPCNPEALKIQLYEQYRIEIPTMTWKDQQYTRISIQAYNTPQDVEALVNALRETLFS
jgi:isopenicillin-N epimerase